MDKHSLILNNYTISEGTLRGKKYIVVPVVMMKEGVHHGSAGPIYHSAEELSSFIEAWNGIPVTIQHPEQDGQGVSANNPLVLDEYQVGTVFNTHYDDGLKAEAWLDPELLNQISDDTIEYIEKGFPLDVSVGVFSDSESAEGEWNGETYTAIAHNYRPDHLALLPGGVGACSWNDGCGIRTNKRGGGEMPKNDLLQTFKDLGKQGYSVSFIGNEKGYLEIMESLQQKVDTLDTNDAYHFIVEVYDDYLVYRKRILDGGGETLFRQDYTVEDSTVVFDGGPTEVRRQVEYITMRKGMQRTAPSNNTKEGGTMSKNDTPCCEGKVDNLIANENSRFAATDKEWLMTLNESQIDKLTPVEPKVQANAAEAIETFKSTLVSLDDFIGLMPESMAAEVKKGVQSYKAEREALVKGIMDNSEEGQFTKEALEALSDDVLKGISKSVTKVDTKSGVTYAGQGNPKVQDNSGEEPVMVPPGHGSAEKK